MKQNPITENSSKLDLRTESNSIRRTLGRKYIVNSKVQTIFIGYGLAMGGLFLAIGFLISITFQRFLLLQSVGGELMTGLDIWLPC